MRKNGEPGDIDESHENTLEPINEIKKPLVYFIAKTHTRE